MKKLKIIFIFIFVVVLICLIGGIINYFNNNDNTTISEKEKMQEIQGEKIEIKISKRWKFSDGMAWVESEDDIYYAINKDGMAVFSISGNPEGEERAVEVKEFQNGYSIVEFKNNDNEFYKKVFDKFGNEVFSEIPNTKKILSLNVDNAGYILIMKLGNVLAVDLKTGEEKPYFTVDGIIDNLDFVSVGDGIFYNKYYGYFDGDVGRTLLLEDLEIYNYNSTLKREMFNSSKYECTGFIDGKAIFFIDSITSHHIFVVTSEGETRKIDNLNGFEIGYKRSGNAILNSTFNGESFYAENEHTNEKGIYDLYGNQLVDLSKYEINEVERILNEKIFVNLNSNILNEHRVTAIDTEENQLFETINGVPTVENDIGNEIFIFMKDIYNYKGEKIATLEDYPTATSFDLSEEDIITVYATSNVSNILMYMNAQLQEIKPYYIEENLKTVVTLTSTNSKEENPKDIVGLNFKEREKIIYICTEMDETEYSETILTLNKDGTAQEEYTYPGVTAYGTYEYKDNIIIVTFTEEIDSSVGDTPIESNFIKKYEIKDEKLYCQETPYYTAVYEMEY